METLVNNVQKDGSMRDGIDTTGYKIYPICIILYDKCRIMKCYKRHEYNWVKNVSEYYY
jgi:hypothetical protein